jgi:hypothetical protein
MNDEVQRLADILQRNQPERVRGDFIEACRE